LPVEAQPIKILFHLNQLGYGGTEKAVLTFCENLDRNRFTPYLFVYDKSNPIKKQLQKLISPLSGKARRKYQKKYLAPWVRLDQFKQVLGEGYLFTGNVRTLEHVVATVQPDVVHFNRGNWEAFFDQAIEVIPSSVACIETNIFGKPPGDNYLQRLTAVYFVSQWLLNKSPWHAGKGKVLFNPIKQPATQEHLRAELGIPADAFVMGRISRPDMIDDMFILEVFEKFQKTVVDANRLGESYLIVLAGSDAIKQKALGFPEVKFIEPTVDEVSLSRFYNSLDVLLHHRIDGETFGMNIAEAMIHAKPVISHLSHVDNAQAELLQNRDNRPVGFVAQEHNLDEYLSYMTELYQNRALAQEMGRNAKFRADELFHEQAVTRFLESEYLRTLNTPPNSR
jgi:glycosyltransferase involved in cell wall biosynthesis